jgi:hypothetical protein
MALKYHPDKWDAAHPNASAQEKKDAVDMFKANNEYYNLLIDRVPKSSGESQQPADKEPPPEPEMPKAPEVPKPQPAPEPPKKEVPKTKDGKTHAQRMAEKKEAEEKAAFEAAEKARLDEIKKKEKMAKVAEAKKAQDELIKKHQEAEKEALLKLQEELEQKRLEAEQILKKQKEEEEARLQELAAKMQAEEEALKEKQEEKLYPSLAEDTSYLNGGPPEPSMPAPINPPEPIEKKRKRGKTLAENYEASKKQRLPIKPSPQFNTQYPPRAEELEQKEKQEYQNKKSKIVQGRRNQAKKHNFIQTITPGTYDYYLNQVEQPPPQKWNQMPTFTKPKADDTNEYLVNEEDVYKPPYPYGQLPTESEIKENKTVFPVRLLRSRENYAPQTTSSVNWPELPVVSEYQLPKEEPPLIIKPKADDTNEYIGNEEDVYKPQYPYGTFPTEIEPKKKIIFPHRQLRSKENYAPQTTTFVNWPEKPQTINPYSGAGQLGYAREVDTPVYHKQPIEIQYPDRTYKEKPAIIQPEEPNDEYEEDQRAGYLPELDRDPDNPFAGQISPPPSDDEYNSDDTVMYETGSDNEEIEEQEDYSAIIEEATSVVNLLYEMIRNYAEKPNVWEAEQYWSEQENVKARAAAYEVLLNTPEGVIEYLWGRSFEIDELGRLKDHRGWSNFIVEWRDEIRQQHWHSDNSYLSGKDMDQLVPEAVKEGLPLKQNSNWKMPKVSLDWMYALKGPLQKVHDWLYADEIKKEQILQEPTPPQTPPQEMEEDEPYDGKFAHVRDVETKLGKRRKKVRFQQDDQIANANNHPNELVIQPQDVDIPLQPNQTETLENLLKQNKARITDALPESKAYFYRHLEPKPKPKIEFVTTHPTEFLEPQQPLGTATVFEPEYLNSPPSSPEPVPAPEPTIQNTEPEVKPKPFESFEKYFRDQGMTPEIRTAREEKPRRKRTKKPESSPMEVDGTIQDYMWFFPIGVVPGTATLEDNLTIGDAIKETQTKRYKRGKQKDERILLASDMPLGARVFGRRLVATPKVLAMGRHATLDNLPEFKSREEYGIYECTYTDMPTKVRLSDSKSKVFAKFENDKRWLNISKMVKDLASGLPKCEFRREFSSIYPINCVIARDYVGREYDATGDMIHSVQSNDPSEPLLVTGELVIGSKGRKASTNSILLDSGAERNEISYQFARQLGIDIDSLPYDGRIEAGGNRVTVKSFSAITYINLYQPPSYQLVQYPIGPIVKKLDFVIPETHAVDNGFDVIIGLEGLHACKINLIFAE